MNANSAKKIAPAEKKSGSAAETAVKKATKTKQLPNRVSKAVTFEYVRQLLIELRGIAQAEGEGTLVYLLEMSALEAQECLKVNKFNTELID